MKKLVAVCGQGLGSFLMVEMAIKDTLENLDIDDIVAEHTNLNSFDGSDSDILAVVCGSDLADAIDFEEKIVLDNLLDNEELSEKISAFLESRK